MFLTRFFVAILVCISPLSTLRRPPNKRGNAGEDGIAAVLRLHFPLVGAQSIDALRYGPFLANPCRPSTFTRRADHGHRVTLADDGDSAVTIGRTDHQMSIRCTVGDGRGTHALDMLEPC